MFVIISICAYSVISSPVICCPADCDAGGVLWIEHHIVWHAGSFENGEKAELMVSTLFKDPSKLWGDIFFLDIVDFFSLDMFLYPYLYTQVFYLCLWCELYKQGCNRSHHCRESPPHCRQCHSWGQRGRTPVRCHYRGWPLNCVQPGSRTALPPVRASIWCPECQCSPLTLTHPLGNTPLKEVYEWSESEENASHRD